MQDRMEWHYLPMTAEQYAQAVQEVTRREKGTVSSVDLAQDGANSCS